MNKSRTQLERLSNAEVGQLLVEYGFPNQPVTATTRKVLLARLRTRMQQDQEKLHRDTSYVTRYSSGEESDMDNRPKMPPPAARKRHTALPTVKVPIQPRNSVFVPPPIVAPDTDEDSDIHLPPDYKHNSYASSRLSGFSFRKRYTPDSTDGPYLDGSTPRFVGTNISSPSNGHNSAEESPYLSEFTKRLLRLRGETVSKEAAATRRSGSRFEMNSSSSTIDNIVHHAPETPAAPRQPQQPQSVQTAVSNLVSRLDEQYGFKQTLVPCLLVSAFVVFIFSVIFAYLTISPDLVNTLSAEVASVELCDGVSLRRPGYSCIERGGVEPALEMLKAIAPELQQRVETHKCRDPERSFTMTASEVIQLAFKTDPGVSHSQLLERLHNMEYLIERNPQWRVNHVSSDGEALTFDEVVQLREQRGNSFGILNPRLPLSCLLRSKMQKFFLTVGALAVALLLMYSANLFWKFVINVKRKRQAKLDKMINEILSALMEQASNENGGLVVVNHLRDKIIPASQRRDMDTMWMEAMEHLKKNESRIQFEMGSRNGEDCHMMRWIDTVSPSLLHHRSAPPGGSAVKKWQSPAFDKSNKIKDPPTACLKIRQMFEKYETNNPNLKTIITDAILEKVGPKCRIFDVQLDKSTCCVYVRCATPKDAGIVHDEINGWWFDNRLVSIKFLRLERYLSRFPKASAGPVSLRPSNTKNLSMSQCFTEPPDNALFDDDEE
ncbi:inner nuclear membrane protein Man1 [Phlebotomus argentipes]|uniref:inner nuclear membrane protein Man1 n=1 Tax=Phlebotomus argentipes TaxID=94469 RepID=UPI002892DFC6|nr:inner nuclear membrane protein Man1 [Phlebotomus argentipes]